jgi:hypothetical protein
MKIKQTVIILATLVGFGATFLNPAVVAAVTCGGVKTSIVSCDQNQTASCADGSDPYGIKQYEYVNGVKTLVPVSTSPVNNNGKCEDGTNPVIKVQDTGLWGILVLVINIMTGGIGILAIAGIIYGSILYTTAGDSSEKVSKARAVIRNVVIGIIAYALMYAGLNFIIPGGLFS